MAALADNLSAVLVCKGDLRLENRPVPKPSKNEVLLAMECVGICGSDVHYWVSGGIGDFIVKKPMVLGHESSGTVIEVGEGVTHLKKGDRVAVEPGVPCRYCDFCKAGRYNLCEDIFFCATPPDDGNLCRYYVHAADFCYKLPDDVSFEEGALLEPLSVGVHSCQRAGVTVGSHVLICGAGPIGLVNLLVAKSMGATKVCMTDVVESRLQVAKELGADSTVLVRGREQKDVIDDIVNVMGGRPNITIECSGAEPSITLAILTTKSGGTVVIVGMGSAVVTIPITNALVREVDIRGIFRYVNCYPKALSLIQSKKIDVRPLVTHRYELEDTLKAFQTAKTGADGAIKVIINCRPKK